MAMAKKRTRDAKNDRDVSKSPAKDASLSENVTDSEISDDEDAGKGLTRATPSSDDDDTRQEDGNVPKKPRGSNYTAPQQAPKIVAAAPVLPWMRLPVSIDAGTGIPLPLIRGLDPRLASVLTSQQISELFPVQAAVWRELAGGIGRMHDLCICAPTGSGKTLAYALPVLQGLLHIPRHHHHVIPPPLRALILVPTRDLALQVHAVMSPLAASVNLTLALIAGRDAPGTEAKALVPTLSHNNSLPSSSAAASAVDIVIATPGRLVSHLVATPGVTLAHLSYLVIDETDRLLRQSYQDWISHVIPTTHPYNNNNNDMQSCSLITPNRVVKMIVSATLTRDPTKLDRLGLHCPRYLTLTGSAQRYSLPSQLAEWRVECRAANKPFVLAALIQQLLASHPRTREADEGGGGRILIFTSSVDAAHRLYLALDALSKSSKQPSIRFGVVEFSSHLPASQRASNLEKFRRGAMDLLVCSDAATRGMDVASVETVINYDMPVYIKTYVHRAGRTARAGRSGQVITLLREKEVKYFKNMLRKAENNFVREYKVAEDKVKEIKPLMEVALKGMQQVLARESGGVVVMGEDPIEGGVGGGEVEGEEKEEG